VIFGGIDLTCADTSSWIAFFEDADGDDVPMLEEHLHQRSIILSPVVVAELFSNPGFSDAQRRLVLNVPVLDLRPGFWQRAGLTRAGLLKRRFRPKLADTLIAQSCMDAAVPLLTRDRDFLPFAKHVGLKLIFPF
jgi:predicted nucleic acid-binding protein